MESIFEREHGISGNNLNGLASGESAPGIDFFVVGFLAEAGCALVVWTGHDSNANRVGGK